MKNIFVSCIIMFVFHCQIVKCEVHDLYYGSDITKIYCDDNIMYLPSYIDFSCMNYFSFPEGTILRGTELDALTIGKDIIDMHVLFGTNMVSGVKYCLQAEYISGFVTNFYIAKSENIPSLHISLDNEKDITFLNASKRNEASGKIIKIFPDGSSSKLLTIKKIAGRGNASWTKSGEKKPYKINLSEKYALINNSSKNKKFALMSCNCNIQERDLCGLSDYIAHELAESLGMNFNPDLEFVDLYINGSYRGFYTIKERVTIGNNRVNINEAEYDFEDEISTTRIIQKNGIKGVNNESGDVDDEKTLNASLWDIPDATTTIRSTDDNDDPALKAGIQAYQYATDSILSEGKNGGVIIEMNYCFDGICADEHIFFITRRGQIFTMKTPEVATKEQVQNISIFVQEFEDALFNEFGINYLGKHYSDYLDVVSMAKHIFLDSFMYNPDFGLVSTYFYIDVDPSSNEFIGKLIAEPVWDYDNSKLQSFHFFPIYHSCYYIPQFFYKADFIKAMYNLQIEQNGFVSKLRNLNNTEIPFIAEKLSPTFQLNYLRFGCDSLFYVNRITNRMKSRETFWNGVWKPQKNNLGGSIEMSVDNTSPVLSISLCGKALSYQWYKLENDGSVVLLENENDSTIDPQLHGKGEYICGIYGNNLENKAGGDYITLYTSPFSYDLPEPRFLLVLLFLSCFSKFIMQKK